MVNVHTRQNYQVIPFRITRNKRKPWLKLLGITFQEDTTNWDIHIDDMLSKASSQMYILRVCKSYGSSKDQLNNLFNSLVMSVFLYGIEVWGAAYQRKYLDRIDWFLKKALRFGFTTKKQLYRDSKLCKNVISDDHVLHDFLPLKRRRVPRESSMTLYYLELKPNASSIVSLIDASSIKFTVYKELHNITCCNATIFTYS